MDTLLAFVREGDTLIVTRLDRLARSMDDLLAIGRELQGRGVHLKAAEQPVDTSTATGKAFFQMLGVFAEFEANLRRERQMEGIAKAKAEGVYKGRRATIDLGEARKLRDQGFRSTEIARQLGISRTPVYRVLGRMTEL